MDPAQLLLRGQRPPLPGPKLVIGTSISGGASDAKESPGIDAPSVFGSDADNQRRYRPGAIVRGSGTGASVGTFPASPETTEFESGGDHDILRLSADLDRHLVRVLDHSDAIDTSEFNCIEYANLIFPSEQSLSSADKVLERLRQQIKLLDREIKDLVRHQSDASQQTRQELEDVKQGILNLVARIKAIQNKATESEHMVLEITQDIKSLDRAKKNLTHAINVFRRLKMFTNALDQLRGVANRKQYRETAHLLQICLQFMRHFKAYKDVTQVAALCDAVVQFENEIKRTIFNEFEAGFTSGTFKMQAQVLNDACVVIESLEFDAKTQLIDWYCDMQLKDYRGIFRNNPEVAGLSDISRRYAWLKRSLKTHDEQHAPLFPTHWRVAECLTTKFCEDTRKDLTEILSRTDKENTLDTMVMLQGMQTTMEFESKLDSRFTPKDPSEMIREEPAPLTASSKFYRIISSCFEIHLWRYIDMEDKALAEKFELFRTQPPTADEESVLLSSTELFIFYRQSIVNCAKLSTRKPFLDLCKMLGKWLKSYNDVLLSKLPKDDKRVVVHSDEDLKVICLVMNTADYCANTTAQLEERLIDKIDTEFKGLLSMSAEKDALTSCCLTAIQALVRAVENANEPAFQAMVKRPWGSLSSVGDQSEHITTIATTLSAAIRLIRATISATKFFRTFCDRFAESFLARYLNTIYKCRPLSEVGAEQMLLDTHALKNILMEMSILGADPPQPQAPPAYAKIVAKNIAKVEQLLKVVLRPQDPPDLIVDTYNVLYQDYNAANFQKILELKGLRRSEMQQILDVFQVKVPAGARNAPSGQTSSSTSSSSSSAAASSGLVNNGSAGRLASQMNQQDATSKPAMSNFKPDFRKFMNNMNMKRNG